MALLLYKSNEMFSSTELIRKSKMIFDKILGRKIEKAIILRDGKPSFLLMEFSKYEKIMAEYEDLKNFVAELEEGTVSQNVKPLKSEKKKKQKTQNLEEKKEKTLEDKMLKEELVEKSKRIAIPKMDYVEDIAKAKEKKQENKSEPKQLVEKPDTTSNEDMVKEEQSIQDEIAQAYSSIDSMQIDESMKQQAKEKIKQRILQARKERESMQREDPETKKVEEELEQQIQEEKRKKEQELEEFWD